MFHTVKDTMNEKYIYGAKLVGKYQFPQLEETSVIPNSDHAVPFHIAAKEKNPKKAICHFFEDDYQFERVWKDCDRYIPILKNFKAVCTPDFSSYSNMPLAMQIWNRYRNRSLAYYMWLNDVNIVPTVGWGSEETYGYCFDGLPKNSTLSVSTNGCFTKEGKECYRNGFKEMCRRLEPNRIIIIGREIEVDVNVEKIYLNSYGQEMSNRLERK